MKFAKFPKQKKGDLASENEIVKKEKKKDCSSGHTTVVGVVFGMITGQLMYGQRMLAKQGHQEKKKVQQREQQWTTAEEYTGK